MIERGVRNVFAPLGRRLWPRAPVILIYHRVGDPDRDVWGVTVSPERFDEQVEAVKQVRRIAPLGEVFEAVRDRRESDRPLAAITFDDGYHDVFAAARPILHRHDAPATVFVVSGLIGAPREFWWDELAFIFLEDHELPGELEMRFAARRQRWTLPAGDRRARAGACHQVRREFRDLGAATIEAHLTDLRAWAKLERPAREVNRAMTAAEVRALRHDLLSLGAHTVWHPSLPFLPMAEQRAEIADGRRACEELIEDRVPHFAYPFGAYDGRAVRLAREAGFETACTTVPGVVGAAADPYRLPRIAPGQMAGEALARALA